MKRLEDGTLVDIPIVKANGMGNIKQLDSLLNTTSMTVEEQFLLHDILGNYEF